MKHFLDILPHDPKMAFPEDINGVEWTEEALAKAIQEGIDSGIAEDFSPASHKEKMRKKYGHL